MKQSNERVPMVSSGKAIWKLALRPCQSRWLHGLNCVVVWALCLALLAVVISPAAMEYWAASWLVNFDQVNRGMKQLEVRQLLGTPSIIQATPEDDVGSVWEYHSWSRLKVYYISFDRHGRVLSCYAQ